MSGFIRQIKLDDGTPITPPSTVATSAASYAVFANDAAYEAAFPGPTAGAVYYNSTECIVREYDGTNWVYSQQAYNGVNDSTSTGTDQELDLAPYNIVRFTEGSLQSIIGLDPSKVKVLYLSNEQGGQAITLKNQDGGATAGYEIITGTGDDLIIEDGQTIPLVYDGDRTAWLVVGGVGGGGGLENVIVDDTSSPVTTEVGKRYLADSTNGAIIFNLPQISTIPGSKEALANVVITDCSGTAQTNNLTVNAFAGDDIDFQDGTTDTALAIDMQGQTVGFSRIDANTWCQSSGLQPSVISDGGGTGQGAKNYVLSPDDSSEIATTGGVAVIDTTTLADLPEESKEKGVLVTQTSGAAGDKATWNVNPIDDGDNSRIGTNEIYIKTQAGYVDDDATVRWVDATTGEIFGETDIKTTTTYLSGASLELLAGNDLAPEIEFNVTDSTGLVVSGVGVLAQNPLVGSFGGWKSYEAGTDFTVSGTLSTYSGQLKPFKDPITGKWFVSGNILVNLGSESTINGNQYVISGLTFSDNFDTGGQAVTLFVSGASFTLNRQSANATALDNLGTIHVNSSAANVQFISISINCELASKPTWADFDDTVSLGSDLEESNAVLVATSDNGQAVGGFGTIIYEDVSKDNLGNYDNTTGIYTVSSPGDYQVDCQIRSTTDIRAYIAVNGTVVAKGNLAGSGEVAINSTLLENLQIGDEIAIESGASTARTLETDATGNRFTISKKNAKSTTLTGFPLSSQANENKQYLVVEYRTYTLNLVNDGTSNMNGVINFVKIGTTVTYSSEAVITHDSSSSPVSSSVLPTWLWPNAAKDNCFLYFNDAGCVSRITTSGTFQLLYFNETTGVSRTTSAAPCSGSYVLP